ncbi:MAG TPA: hypothetical protein PLY91_09390 [Methanoregulaceae archaeon]|nr:hypothetical protein [Methanoregulaceae archaeon]
MVLHTRNTGKYLSRSWNAERARAMENPDLYSAADLAYYEVPAVVVGNDAFLADTAPVDPATSPREYDVRDPRYRPEVGR